MAHKPGFVGRMSVSVVVPCYRSESTLAPLVEQLIAELTPITSDLEIVLVVDGSPDNTWQVATRLARDHDTVHALRLARNYGQHNALLAGIRHARHEVTVTMDDDLQHRPDQVAVLLAAMTSEVDLVYGIALQEEHRFLRSLGSRVTKWAVSRGRDAGHVANISAFRAFRGSLKRGLDHLTGPRPSIDVALAWSTDRAVSVPVRMDRRAVGTSNYSLGMLVRQAANLVLAYSTAPLRLVAYLGLASALFGFALLSYVLVAYLAGITTVAGFTTLTSAIAIFSGTQMLSLGVIGEYLAELHQRGGGRPLYVVAETTGARHPGEGVLAEPREL